MSEAANFLFFIDENPEINAIESGAPPVPPSVYAPPYEISGLPWTAPPPGTNSTLRKREHFDTYDYGNVQGAANLSSEWLYPPYDLNDTRMTEGTMGFNNYGTAKNLSDKTIRTDLVHANGYREYEIHNMFGFMFSRATHAAMLKRRPNKKPFLISRSTFLGSGSYTG
jgi:alpha-glucosidase